MFGMVNVPFSLRLREHLADDPSKDDRGAVVAAAVCAGRSGSVRRRRFLLLPAALLIAARMHLEATARRARRSCTSPKRTEHESTPSCS